jgi:hypothetical protein
MQNSSQLNTEKILNVIWSAAGTESECEPLSYCGFRDYRVDSTPHQNSLLRFVEPNHIVFVYGIFVLSVQNVID